jgi:release factor glutamine methyltransferase
VRAGAARRDAAALLRASGVASPERDADLLLAHVLDVGLGRLPLVDDLDPDQLERYDALLARRAAREPLQHLTGSAAFRHVELAVGPGVFVPRPETELLAGWAIEQALAIAGVPVVVDLCTGSGAIAAAVKDEVPHAEVHAVELSPEAFGYAQDNLSDVDLRLGDAFEAFDELVGAVDVVVCNPPYIPLDAWESVAVEARDHDPHIALFSGDDGLVAMRRLEARAALLLRPGGVVGAEHADAQGEAAPAVFVASGRWRDVRDHRDLAGRARYLTARLAR